jgi:hypothetical protein
MLSVISLTFGTGCYLIDENGAEDATLHLPDDVGRLLETFLLFRIGSKLLRVWLSETGLDKAGRARPYHFRHQALRIPVLVLLRYRGHVRVAPELQPVARAQRIRNEAAGDLAEMGMAVDQARHDESRRRVDCLVAFEAFTTGANRSRCFIASAFNSSIDASSLNRAGLFDQLHGAEWASQYDAANAAECARITSPFCRHI